MKFPLYYEGHPSSSHSKMGQNGFTQTITFMHRILVRKMKLIDNLTRKNVRHLLRTSHGISWLCVYHMSYMVPFEPEVSGGDRGIVFDSSNDDLIHNQL